MGAECETCHGALMVNVRETAPHTYEADACPECMDPEVHTKEQET